MQITIEMAADCVKQLPEGSTKDALFIHFTEVFQLTTGKPTLSVYAFAEMCGWHSKHKVQSESS